MIQFPVGIVTSALLRVKLAWRPSAQRSKINKSAPLRDNCSGTKKFGGCSAGGDVAL
jgi:hypothetical protein